MKKQTLILTVILLSVLTLFSMKAPQALKIDKQISLHNLSWNDHYAYLKYAEYSKQTMKYIKAENNYTKNVSKQFADLEKTVYNEMLSRINDQELSVPYKKGNWMYYYQTVKDKPYGIDYRINIHNLEKQILIDENEMAMNKKFFSLGLYSISYDENTLAYSVDFEGSEDYILHFKDIKTNKLYPEMIKNVDELVWLPDNKTILYTVHNDQFSTNKIFKHILGTDPSSDKLLMEEKNDAFSLSVYLSRDKQIVFITSSSKTTTENWYFSALNNDDIIKPILTKRSNKEDYPDHFNNRFYLLTNEFEPNYQYYLLNNLNSFSDAELLFSGNKHTVLNEVLHFNNYYVVAERINGENRIRIINKQTREESIPNLKNNSYSLTIGTNPEIDADSLRLEFDSMTVPAVSYSYNLINQTLITLKQHNPKGEYDSNLYEEKLLMVKTTDNQEIPLSIIYRKDMFKQDNPCLLYAYGAYGISEDPYFSSIRLSLLDRGWVYAVAHIRGGGEFGKDWHNQGRLLNRKNTFNDFILCAEYLIKEKYTSPQQLCINGGSAGGMLMGAVMNMRPELFKAVVADVPFVDVLNTMMDSTMALTVPEYDEWGNPSEKIYFDYIRGYSPYDNIVRQDYPNLLINAGFKDSRVMYWEPLKWTAKLREYKTDNNLLLLNMYMNEGHSGSGDRYASIREYAFTYAFLIWIVNQ